MLVSADNKRKHLEFIQGTVNRMASNLFLLKGWTVTLIAALFALAAKDARPVYFAIAYFPPLMFWILDAYFLSQERRFRSLYDYVRKLPENHIDFSMDTQPFKEMKGNTWPEALLSKTLVIYYLTLIVLMLVVMIVLLRGM